MRLIYQQAEYQTPNGQKVVIKEIWYGKTPRVILVLNGNEYERTREQFFEALDNGKIIKK